MDVNDYIKMSETFPRTQQQQSMAQDNQKKADFALEYMKRIPQQPSAPADPPKIPSLGALAIPN